MKLFTVGPVEMYESTLELGRKALPYFRTADFSKTILFIREKMLELTNCDGDMVLLASSGSGGLEAAVLNGTDDKDKILVVNGGFFGKRFCEILDSFEMKHDEIRLKFGESLTKEHFLPYENKGYTKLFIQACETSTGQLYDLKMVGDFCKRNNIMLIVDDVSSFLIDHLDMQEMNIDMLIIGSQKGLALPPGLAIMMISSRMKEYINNNKVKSLYFNLKDYFKFMEKGQTPFTPPVGIIMQLEDKLKSINLEEEINKHAQRANYFRTKAKEIGIGVPMYPLSNGLTPILFENDNAIETFERLIKDYGYVLTKNGGDLVNKVLRVGHMGNLKLEDFDNLLKVIK